MIARPSARSRRTRVKRRSTSSSVSDDGGSSRARARTLELKARKISISWRWAEGSMSPIKFNRRDLGETVAGEIRPDTFLQRCEVDEGPTVWQLAQEDVFGDGDAGDDLRLLVDDPNACPMGIQRIREFRGLTAEAERSGVRLIIAVD